MIKIHSFSLTESIAHIWWGNNHDTSHRLRFTFGTYHHPRTRSSLSFQISEFFSTIVGKRAGSQVSSLAYFQNILFFLTAPISSLIADKITVLDQKLLIWAVRLLRPLCPSIKLESSPHFREAIIEYNLAKSLLLEFYQDGVKKEWQRSRAWQQNFLTYCSSTSITKASRNPNFPFRHDPHLPLQAHFALCRKLDLPWLLPIRFVVQLSWYLCFPSMSR